MPVSEQSRPITLHSPSQQPMVAVLCVG